MTVTYDGKKILVITPQAPLGEALIGRRVGDAVEVETSKTSLEYEILGIA